MAEGAKGLGERRTTLVLTLPGDRRDEDLVASVRALGSLAQRYVLYESDDLRDREPGETVEIIRSALPAGVAVEVAAGRDEAIQIGWLRTRPGERLIVIADDKVDETLAAVHNLVERADTGAACEVLQVDEDVVESRRQVLHST